MLNLHSPSSGSRLVFSKWTTLINLGLVRCGHIFIFHLLLIASLGWTKSVFYLNYWVDHHDHHHHHYWVDHIITIIIITFVLIVVVIVVVKIIAICGTFLFTVEPERASRGSWTVKELSTSTLNPLNGTTIWQTRRKDGRNICWGLKATITAVPGKIFSGKEAELIQTHTSNLLIGSPCPPPLPHPTSIVNTKFRYLHRHGHCLLCSSFLLFLPLLLLSAQPCQPGEGDKHESGCYQWKKQGYCTKASLKEFMKKQCYATCGYCIRK